MDVHQRCQRQHIAWQNSIETKLDRVLDQADRVQMHEMKNEMKEIKTLLTTLVKPRGFITLFRSSGVLGAAGGTLRS